MQQNQNHLNQNDLNNLKEQLKKIIKVKMSNNGHVYYRKEPLGEIICSFIWFAVYALLCFYFSIDLIRQAKKMEKYLEDFCL